MPLGVDQIVAFGLTQDPMLVNIYYMGLFVARAIIEPEGTSVTESSTGSKTMVPGPQETKPSV